MKHTTIDEFLTSTEIEAAVKLFQGSPNENFAKHCAADIIRPVISRINKTLDQENDPLYLAYCVEYVLRNTVDFTFNKE